MCWPWIGCRKSCRFPPKRPITDYLTVNREASRADINQLLLAWLSDALLEICREKSEICRELFKFFLMKSIACGFLHDSN